MQLKHECPICIDKIAKNDELILECCNQKICKMCDDKNVSGKCWFCRQIKKTKNPNIEKNVFVIFCDYEQNNPEGKKTVITKMENNIDDTNDLKQLNIIIKCLFPTIYFGDTFNITKLQNMEDAINELKNVNYDIKIIEKIETLNHVTRHNLLSLIIDKCIFRYVNCTLNVLTFLQTEKITHIVTTLIQKNINYEQFEFWNISIVQWCKNEHDRYKKNCRSKKNENHEFCFYFYDEIMKCINLQNKKKLAENSKFSFKRFFCCCVRDLI